MDLFARLIAQGAMIEGLASDSRRCTPGVAFLAYPGEAADGRAHIGDALRRGASAVLWDDAAFTWREEWRVPNAGVRELKQQAGALAHQFYGRPSEKLWVCGVTGTNGKTSCSHWIAAALARRGVKAGVIGTLGNGFPGALAGGVNTTPDALDTQLLLRDFLQQGARAVAMEVSSHGLVQGRVNAVRFACALFTNLSHDHLDYHGSLRAYAEAKARLFDSAGLGAAVLNLDDPVGVEIAQRLAARGVRTLGYGFAATAPVPVAEYLPAGLLPDNHTRQLGRFNVANALGVLGCLLAHGLARDEALRLIEALPPIPGRMQAVSEEPLVVIDYAHTPDALEKVLQALRPIAAARGGRLVVVFGAGGERDAAKRPLMGAAVSRLADGVVVTSDNPRGEDPLAIIAQIARGIDRIHVVEADRGRAIERALDAAAPKDVVLLAGKGHERTQEIGGRRLPFSDEAAARAALARRKAP